MSSLWDNFIQPNVSVIIGIAKGVKRDKGIEKVFIHEEIKPEIFSNYKI